MIRLTLYNFFNLLTKGKDKITYDILSKYINNDSLIEEILLKIKFKKLWRHLTNTKIVKEKYKLTYTKSVNHLTFHTLFVKVTHILYLWDSSEKKVSKENLNLAITLTKDKLFSKCKILNICNEEYEPLLYKKIKNNPSISYIPYSNSLYWQRKIDNIDSLNFLYKKDKEKLSLSNSNRNISNYDRKKAIDYARKYALYHNNKYKDFSDSGGDCTNFVSQCLYAGGIPLSSLWKPYSGPWIRVTELYYYLLRNSIGYESKEMFDLRKGSIIQFFSNQKGYYSHSGIITDVLSNGDCLYCCHSYDKLDYPLSEIYPIIYDKFRIIHINY